MKPGEIICEPGTIVLNEGRPTVTLKVKNTSDHAVQITSHFHFFEANKRLAFDRAMAYGMRLDIPAGGGVRFEPGEEKEVRLVPFEGRRTIWGFNGLVNGALTDVGREAAVERARQRGFITEYPEAG